MKRFQLIKQRIQNRQYQSITLVVTALIIVIYALSSIKPTPQGGQFSLNTIDGPISLDNFNGQWLVLYFGYASCPDVCPTDLARWNQVFNQLHKEGVYDIAMMFVSVDFERDTPERLAQYAQYFNPNFKAATADQAEITHIAQAYGVTWEKVYQSNSAMTYSIDHSTYSYLINPDGKLVRMFKQTTAVDALANEIQKQLREFSDL